MLLLCILYRFRELPKDIRHLSGLFNHANITWISPVMFEVMLLSIPLHRLDHTQIQTNPSVAFSCYWTYIKAFSFHVSDLIIHYTLRVCAMIDELNPGPAAPCSDCTEDPQPFLCLSLKNTLWGQHKPNADDGCCCGATCFPRWNIRSMTPAEN